MLQAQNSGPEDTDSKMVETPRGINAGRGFSSKLPYCERTKGEIKNRVLMDDGWILQIEVRFRLVALFVLWLFRMVLIIGRVSVWLGRSYRFPQHLSDRQPL
jgi:hypothetical protein